MMRDATCHISFKGKNQIKTTKIFLSIETLSIRKSSKRKQRLYEKFLKTAKSEA